MQPPTHPVAAALKPEQDAAMEALASYLDDVGFVRLYKYIASPNLYYVNPHLACSAHQDRVADVASYLQGDYEDLGLALCLLCGVPLDEEGLTGREREVAERLLAAGLLRRRDGLIFIGPYQLIAVQGGPLLVDTRVNFPGPITHEVYFGVDSMLLTHYVDTARIERGSPVLDLGTGSGLVGLYLAEHSDRVTVTDIAPAPLALAALNRALRRKAATVEIRAERYEQTLGRGDRYQIITFNPPFVALPQDLDAPIFAKGPGIDGLDYCRMLIERLDDLLLPGGVAYIVADLLGDRRGPYFARDLDAYAGRQGLAIDLLIDSRNDYSEGREQFEVLGAYLQRENPTLSVEECTERVAELHLRTIRAECSYLSVMALRKAGGLGRGLRVLDRLKGQPLAVGG